VAKAGVGWLGWGMGGLVGRWLAKLGDGWLNQEIGG
jgi:hypothetical protein